MINENMVSESKTHFFHPSFPFRVIVLTGNIKREVQHWI